MALKDLVVPKSVITLSEGQSFEVRGITLTDLSAMLDHDYDAVAALFLGDVKIEEALRQTPTLIHIMIAHCAGEPDEVEKVASLPIGIQVEALVKLWELSTLDPDELGNVMRGLVEGVQKFGDSLGFDLANKNFENGSTPSKSQQRRSSIQGTGKKK